MLKKQATALTVEEVQARFQQWRRQKQGRAAIPDELWRWRSCSPAETA